MTTPRVIELPRRLEAVGRDTFLGEDSPVTAHVDNVVALRPHDTVTQLRPFVPQPPRAAA